MGYRTSVEVGDAWASVRITTDEGPPPLLGDGCGCTREHRAGTWILELCPRHSQEYVDTGGACLWNR